MNSSFRIAVIAFLFSFSFCATASAQLDRVYDMAGENVSGTVTATNAKGIQLKKGSNTQTFMAGEIQKVLYEGDPSELTKAREFALDGQYEQALKELKAIDLKKVKRDVIKADVEFYAAYCQSRLALSGKAKKNDAAKMMLGFAAKYRDSWHFFDAAKLLGDLALELGDTKKAMTYYGSLKNAPAEETKILSVYLQGMVHLKSKANDAALAEFDKVIGLKAQTARTGRIQSLAKAGKAVALAQSKKADEGLAIVNDLIKTLNKTDVEMASRIYNARGAAYDASGDAEGALQAYLHTHLMFSTQPDAHAEALVRLVDLWEKVGKPERAAEARQELQQRYPGIQ